jgi:hypothetical protein
MDVPSCKREKTEVIIYNKTEAPGVGKTKSLEFLGKYVIGEKLCILNCGTESLLTNNNKILMGKILVLSEELSSRIGTDLTRIWAELYFWVDLAQFSSISNGLHKMYSCSYNL